MFDVNVVSNDRVRHYSVVPAGIAGWEVKLEEDHCVRWRETYEDWHRVERRMSWMRQQVSDLLDRGWRIEPVNR
jgi:hypothetical protein